MADSPLIIHPKNFNNNADYISVKTWRQWLICHKRYYSAAFAQVLANPERIFQGDNIQYLKQGDTTTVALIKIDECQLVVKRYNLISLRHRLRRLLRPTRAWLSWRNAHYLLQLNIATPQPVAMLEQRFGPFHGVAYYLSEYVAGVSALDYFMASTEPELCKAVVRKKLVTLLQTLAHVCLAHRDMKATNIIINQSEHHIQPYLIDLDAMHYIKNERRWLRAKKRDWRRFMANWQKYPEIYAAFAADLKGEDF